MAHLAHRLAPTPASRVTRFPTEGTKLMWSFNRDGEADEALLENRDQHMQLDTEHKRSYRRELVELAHTQQGMDTLNDAFPGTDGTPPGVRDASEASKG